MAMHFKVSGRRQSSVGSYKFLHFTKKDDKSCYENSRSRLNTETSDADSLFEEDTILLNVGGKVFETHLSTLYNPQHICRLSDEDFLRSHYRVSHGDYFFDRDPETFSCVLNFLRTGRLHVPTHVCGPMMKQEMVYWGVKDEEIERCCWGYYNTWNSQNDTLDQLERDINSSGTSYDVDEATATPALLLKSRIWDLLENPSSSKSARVYAWISILFVLVSIFTFCAETHPAFLVTHEEDILADFFITDNLVSDDNPSSSTPAQSKEGSPSNDSGPSGNTTAEHQDPSHLVPHAGLIVIDFICLFFFTVEFILRLSFSPGKLKFISSALNIIDLVAVLPDYIEFVVISLNPDERKIASFVDFIFILRIIRVLRIFRLIRHVPGLWILLFTLRASVKELILMMVFLMIGMLVFAALMYFAEGHAATDFTNIPVGFWWSLVTMTTVGYGDVYPRTALGYVIGGLCALVGLLMLALTVPIIVGNFVLYYTHIQYILSKNSQKPKPEQHSKQSVFPEENS